MQSALEKISLRELRMLMLGIGAVAVTALVVLFVVPNAKALSHAAGEVRILEQVGQDSGQLEVHLQDQRARIEEMRRRLHGDMANLPARQVEAYIIGRLQRISWNNRVELVSVEPATGDRVQIFQEMLFHVELVGQYPDLYQWLLEARDDLGFVVVKEYELRRHDEQDEAPQLMANLSLATYRAAE